MDDRYHGFLALVGSLYGDGPPITEGDTAELAQALWLSNTLKARLGELVTELEEELAARMETDVLDFPNLGRLERTYDERSAWREKDSAAVLRRDLRERIAQKLAMDRGTGDINPAVRSTVREAIEMVWEAIPSFSSLKRAGHNLVDMENYRTTTRVNRVHFYEIGDLL